MSFKAFGKDIHTGEGQKYGTLELSDAWGTALEPAPITPTSKDAAAFQLLSGTIKATFHQFRNKNEDVREIVVAPGIMSGNTGTNTGEREVIY